MRICKVKNCENEDWRRGYCSKHYSQIRKYGKILKRTIYDKNEIIDCGDWYEICLYNIKCEEITRVKIDKDDLEKVKKYKWHLNNGYVETEIKNKKIKLHQLILGTKKGYEIDHKDGNPLNNLDNNLRFVTHQQNSMNNKSRGYCWNKLRKKWETYIRLNQKKIHLGYFINKRDAIKARKQAEQKYFGEFVYNGKI